MKKLTAIIIALVLALMLVSCLSGSAADNVHSDISAEAESYTVSELIEEMKIGWNLGNTLDAPEGETAWGQPVTTHEMIDKIHELGFNAIRIPVSWGLHTSGAPDYTVDPDWMDRVEEVVNYALDNDMFVILNSHHDNDYYYPSREHEEETYNYIEKLWAQIAERFKDYDQHLIFQPMNEPRLTGTNYEWWIDYNSQQCLDALEIISNCNQRFVDVVRASGGRNAERFLLCGVYCGSAYYSLQDPYKFPEDTAEGRLLISVHAYTPYNLAMNADMSYTDFDASCRREIDDFMTKQYEKYGKNGVGIIIDEMGIINKNNPEAREEWATYFVAKAKSLGMLCCWWDNGGTNTGSESFGLFDRLNLNVFSTAEAPYKGLMAGLETPLEDITPSNSD